MTLSLWIVGFLVLATPATAERITLSNPTNTNANQLFSRLGQYRNAPQTPEELTATRIALDALLGILTPSIQSIANFAGIFAGNCSVFFEELIESVICDLEATNTRTVEPAAEFAPEKRLPEAYWHQITLSHILLATLFADWTRGVTQEYDTNLYFKQGTCSDSMTMSESPTETLSQLEILSTSILRTATASQSVSDKQTRTQSLLASLSLSDESSQSFSQSQTESPSEESTSSTTPSYSSSLSDESTRTSSLSHSSTLSQEATPSPTLSQSQTLSEESTSSTTPSYSLSLSDESTRSSSLSDSFTLSEEATQSSSLSQSQTLSEESTSSPTPSYSWSLSGESTRSSSLSQSSTLSEEATQSSSLSHTASDSLAPGCVPVPPNSGLLAAWNQVGGIYADVTNQTSRYFIAGGVVTDILTNVQWQQVASTNAMTFSAAEIYCAAQTTAHLIGWRVPNIIELQTIVDYNNAGIFGSFPATWIWSSTPTTGIVSTLWSLDAAQGLPEYVLGSTTNNVRCVRSCYPVPPAGRYIIAANTVTDIVTGLFWQRASVAGPITRASAISYCSGLSLYGTGWRLPTVKEMLTLIDYSVPQGNLMMNSLAFSGEPMTWYWSSTMASPGVGWVLSFSSVDAWNNQISGCIVGGGNYVRCVRSCDTVPPTNGLLAFWTQSGGTYIDVTSQTNRYSVASGIVTDSLTSILWEQAASSSTMNWLAASTYCAGQTTGGLSGWRVPNIAELQTLIDYTVAVQYINTVAFPGAPASNFWSSTLDAGTSGNAWSFNMGGHANSYSISIATFANVRCVRSCYAPPPSVRYIVLSGVVTDSITGLQWEQAASSVGMFLSAATTYCSGRTTGGLAGWRLPKVKELSTLIDYSASAGSLMMDATVFAGQPANIFWTSSVPPGFAGWSINFASSTAFIFYGAGPANNYYVRCVR